MDEQANMSGEPAITKESGVDGAGSPEQARRDLEEEFNVQRAKMKELFLQKEEDMRRMVLEKEQLESEVLGLRAELQQLQTLSENQKSELQSLQLLVSETVEASTSGTEEARRLLARTQELERQLAHTRQQQELSLAPATFVRSLARKLGADTEADQPVKKNVEESELLRSIIQPLEMEISALKHKLRETDAQLQETLKAKAAASSNATSTSEDGKTETEKEKERVSCDMCANYERQLVGEQARGDQARDKAARLDLALKLATEELEGVRSLHDETVRMWQADRVEDTTWLDELVQQVETAEKHVSERANAADAAAARALHSVTALTVRRETLQRKLDCLERDNEVLMGKYMKKAAEIQNEVINLPNTVEELQEQALQLREQLILSQVRWESAEATEQALRDQLQADAGQLHRLEAALATATQDLRAAREQIERMQTEREQMKELADKLRSSGDMIEQLLEDKKRLQAEVSEVRGRVSVLQTELDNSETVQQDFVRLSQSLQVQLQRIREADTEVRWQHDEDVGECPACRTHLPNSKKKVHCRHCGRIFCGACVSHTVASGPRRAPARVCAVCRTLLQPHTAPYFCTAPPHSPA